MNKKSLHLTILLILALFISSCTISPASSLSFDDKVATQAAVVFTATALAEQLSNPTSTSQPPAEATAASTPEPTATLPGDDPVKDLGEPDARDTLSNSGIWFSKNSTSFENEFATFSAKSGSISAVSKRSGGPIWYDYFEKRPANLYLEGKLVADSCSGNDSYGILFRGQDIAAGPGYFFSVSCNGSYAFYTFGTSGNISYIENNQSDSAINTGSGAENTLGIWADGNRIRLYVNGVFLKEITNSSITGDGYVGFFIWSVNGAGLSVNLDEIAYWSLN
jgi:hypothetical protein